MLGTMRTFNVGFECADASHHDETQFDISNGAFVEMVNEIIQLFNDFAEDNCLARPTITYIEEVPYDEYEEVQHGTNG